MARPLRIEYPGAFYHVINRGNAGQAIFKSKRDREKFLSYLEKMVERFGIRLHCYCMMTNHYHLLVETPEANLSKSIQWLNVSYAMYFNVKRGLHGHLFQGRYKSILVDADEYLKHLSRYIHLNPLRCNIVEKIEDYPWGSYQAYVGKEKIPEWLETDWILQLFGKNRKAANRAYRDFTEGIDIKKIRNPSSDVIGGLILGSPGFVDWVKQTFLQPRPDDREFSGLSDLKPRPSVSEVARRVADSFDCTIDHIICKGKRQNVARDVAIYISRETTGQKAVDLGHFFGGVRGQTITMCCAKVKRAMENNKSLKRDINRLLED
jgi:putative transposase